MSKKEGVLTLFKKIFKFFFGKGSGFMYGHMADMLLILLSAVLTIPERSAK